MESSTVYILFPIGRGGGGIPIQAVCVEEGSNSSVGIFQSGGHGEGSSKKVSIGLSMEPGVEGKF
jgi:hypothetical protein